MVEKQHNGEDGDEARRKFEEALARKSRLRRASEEGRDAVNGGTDLTNRRRTTGDKQ